MSKSLKNAISIDETLQKYSADTFRMACVLSNYRNIMEYGDEMMETALSTNLKFNSFKVSCEDYLNGKTRNDEAIDSEEVLKKFEEIKKQVDECLRNDFDTARMMTALSDLTKTANPILNKYSQSSMDYHSSFVDVIGPIYKYTERIFKTLGFRQSSATNQDNKIEELVEDLLKLRTDLRAEAVSSKNKTLFKVCDNIRDTLKNNGVNVKDYSDKSAWSFNKS